MLIKVSKAQNFLDISSIFNQNLIYTGKRELTEPQKREIKCLFVTLFQSVSELFVVRNYKVYSKILDQIKRTISDYGYKFRDRKEKGPVEKDNKEEDAGEEDADREDTEKNNGKENNSKKNNAGEDNTGEEDTGGEGGQG